MHPDVLPEVRATIALRHALLPYLYTQMWRAAVDDIPPVRPLGWDFPHDPAARDVDDAFMLGPDLLVAPVLDEGAVDRRVHLPAHPGGWYDWHDGTPHAGRETTTVPAPLGRLPLFVRAGSAIPVERDGATALAVFGTAAPGDFPGDAGALYRDDGESAAWRATGRLIRFALRPLGDALVLIADGLEDGAALPVTVVGPHTVRLGPGLVITR